MKDGWTITRQQVNWHREPATFKDAYEDVLDCDHWVLRRYDRVVATHRCVLPRTLRVQAGGNEAASLYQWLRYRFHDLDIDPNAPDWSDYELLADMLTASALTAQREVLPLPLNDRSAA